MKQKVISMVFKANDEVVSQLSKDFARPDDVIAALQFLDKDCTLSVTIKELDIPTPSK